MKTGPKYKICRRLDDSVFTQCETPKFQISKSKKQKTAFRGRRKSKTEYGLQLLEKQKVRFTYNISEKQMSNYVKKAQGVAGATPIHQLYKSLELRLDSVAFKAGYIATKCFARQVVSHGHVTVNGRRVSIPSYELKMGDVVSIRNQSISNGIFSDLKGRLKEYDLPNHLKREKDGISVTVKSLPSFADRTCINLNFNSAIEFYSRV